MTAISAEEYEVVVTFLKAAAYRGLKQNDKATELFKVLIIILLSVLVVVVLVLLVWFLLLVVVFGCCEQIERILETPSIFYLP